MSTNAAASSTPLPLPVAVIRPRAVMPTMSATTYTTAAVIRRVIQKRRTAAARAPSRAVAGSGPTGRGSAGGCEEDVTALHSDAWATPRR